MKSSSRQVQFDEDVEDYDLPHPGKPPKPDTWKWAPLIAPAILIAKAEVRARWGWLNFRHHEKLMDKSKVITDDLNAVRHGLRTDHRQ
jgi:hypothetical protein